MLRVTDPGRPVVPGPEHDPSLQRVGIPTEERHVRDLLLRRAHRACGVEPEDPAGTEDAGDLAERGLEIVHVLEHAERDDEVERRRLAGNLLGGTDARVDLDAVACRQLIRHRQRRLLGIDPDGTMTELPEGDQAATLRAPHLEDVERPLRRKHRLQAREDGDHPLPTLGETRIRLLEIEVLGGLALGHAAPASERSDGSPSARRTGSRGERSHPGGTARARPRSRRLRTVRSRSATPPRPCRDARPGRGGSTARAPREASPRSARSHPHSPRRGAPAARTWS